MLLNKISISTNLPTVWYFLLLLDVFVLQPPVSPGLPHRDLEGVLLKLSAIKRNLQIEMRKAFDLYK